jgi:uncharacterized protein YbjT (DUF2867 family)
MMHKTGKSALVIGGSGLVGSHIVALLAQSSIYHTIVVAGRRPLEFQSDKIKFSPLELSQISQLTIDIEIDDVFCALGTTIKKAKTQEAFRSVDFDAVVELAQWAKQRNVKHFAVVSSIGATTRTKNFYLKTKGQMENRLMQMGLDCLIIVRPSLLLGKRTEVRTGEKIGEALSMLIDPILRLVAPKYRAIEAEKVARAMVAFCETKFGDTFIIESDQLQTF